MVMEQSQVENNIIMFLSGKNIIESEKFLNDFVDSDSAWMTCMSILYSNESDHIRYFSVSLLHTKIKKHLSLIDLQQQYELINYYYNYLRNPVNIERNQNSDQHRSVVKRIVSSLATLITINPQSGIEMIINLGFENITLSAATGHQQLGLIILTDFPNEISVLDLPKANLNAITTLMLSYSDNMLQIIQNMFISISHEHNSYASISHHRQNIILSCLNLLKSWLKYNINIQTIYHQYKPLYDQLIFLSFNSSDSTQVDDSITVETCKLLREIVLINSNEGLGLDSLEGSIYSKGSDQRSFMSDSATTQDMTINLENNNHHKSSELEIMSSILSALISNNLVEKSEAIKYENIDLLTSVVLKYCTELSSKTSSLVGVFDLVVFATSLKPRYIASLTFDALLGLQDIPTEERHDSLNQPGFYQQLFMNLLMQLRRPVQYINHIANSKNQEENDDDYTDYINFCEESTDILHFCFYGLKDQFFNILLQIAQSNETTIVDTVLNYELICLVLNKTMSEIKPRYGANSDAQTFMCNMCASIFQLSTLYYTSFQTSPEKAPEALMHMFNHSISSFVYTIIFIISSPKYRDNLYTSTVIFLLNAMNLLSLNRTFIQDIKQDNFLSDTYVYSNQLFSTFHKLILSGKDYLIANYNTDIAMKNDPMTNPTVLTNNSEECIIKQIVNTLNLYLENYNNHFYKFRTLESITQIISSLPVSPSSGNCQLLITILNPITNRLAYEFSITDASSNNILQQQQQQVPNKIGIHASFENTRQILENINVSSNNSNETIINEFLRNVFYNTCNINLHPSLNDSVLFTKLFQLYETISKFKYVITLFLSQSEAILKLFSLPVCICNNVTIAIMKFASTLFQYTSKNISVASSSSDPLFYQSLTLACQIFTAVDNLKYRVLSHLNRHIPNNNNNNNNNNSSDISVFNNVSSHLQKVKSHMLEPDVMMAYIQLLKSIIHLMFHNDLTLKPKSDIPQICNKTLEHIYNEVMPSCMLYIQIYSEHEVLKEWFNFYSFLFQSPCCIELCRCIGFNLLEILLQFLGNGSLPSLTYQSYYELLYCIFTCKQLQNESNLWLQLIIVEKITLSYLKTQDLKQSFVNALLNFSNTSNSRKFKMLVVECLKLSSCNSSGDEESLVNLFY